MSTWKEIADQIAAAGPTGPDVVRRKKLADLYTLTKRPVILYAVEMFNQDKIRSIGGDIAIGLGDRVGFQEALRGISGKKLDVILHSPGGSPEATESIVKLLRSRFEDIRFLIPNMAKSAATMLAMSGNQIIIEDDAELGPTDPQMIINGRLNPAHAILQQFDDSKKELGKDPKALTAWLPILQQYGPSLLVECANAIKLTKSLVTQWLRDYMLVGQPSAGRKAAIISKFLSDKKHLSHGRAILPDDLQKRGVNILKASECTPDLREALQDINYALMQTFSLTGAVRIFENHLGKGLYRTIAQFVPMSGRPPTPKQL